MTEEALPPLSTVKAELPLMKARNPANWLLTAPASVFACSLIADGSNAVKIICLAGLIKC